MYVCMHACMYVCMYVCMYAYDTLSCFCCSINIQDFFSKYAYVCMYVRMYVHVLRRKLLPKNKNGILIKYTVYMYVCMYGKET
jgi:hypothetical protein